MVLLLFIKVTNHSENEALLLFETHYQFPYTVLAYVHGVMIIFIIVWLLFVMLHMS